MRSPVILESSVNAVEPQVVAALKSFNVFGAVTGSIQAGISRAMLRYVSSPRRARNRRVFCKYSGSILALIIDNRGLVGSQQPLQIIAVPSVLIRNEVEIPGCPALPYLALPLRRPCASRY